MSSCSRRITCGRTSFSSQRWMASSSAASSVGSEWPMASSVVRLDFDVVAGALHDQHGPVELANLDAGLVEADGLHGYDAGAGPAFRVALVENFRFGVERVAGEQR